jgi:hypothetical protein
VIVYKAIAKPTHKILESFNLSTLRNIEYKYAGKLRDPGKHSKKQCSQPYRFVCLCKEIRRFQGFLLFANASDSPKLLRSVHIVTGERQTAPFLDEVPNMCEESEL